MYEPPPPDCPSGPPVLTSYVKSGDDLPEHNLVDGHWSVHKLPVNQSQTVKESDHHDLAGCESPLWFLRS